MKPMWIVVVVAGVVLEVLVLAAIVHTRGKLSAGGDVIHMKVSVPVDINGKTQVLAKGTYVMTREGPVLLTCYWVYEYAYLTVSVPIVLIIGGIALGRRKRPVTA